MSIYRKMKLLLRASAEAPLQQCIDANDISIFNQEIKEAEAKVKAVKLHLVGIKREIMILEKVHTERKLSITERESQAIKVMDKEPDLFKELAEIIAKDSSCLESEGQQIDSLKVTERKTLAELKRAIDSIKSHKTKLSVLRASQSGINARQALRNENPGVHSALSDLAESLDSITMRQERAVFDDQAYQSVEHELSDESLMQRLQNAGVQVGVHSVDTVMERLKAQADSSCLAK